LIFFLGKLFSEFGHSPFSKYFSFQIITFCRIKVNCKNQNFT
jgi:hypothetical protein